MASVDPSPLRPDLPVPLAPAGRLAAAVRFGLTLLREPVFDRAHRRTPRLLVLAVLLVLAGQVLSVGWLREPVTTLGVALAVYTALRVAALRVVEHRQREFEPTWLETQSAHLRHSRFEVVRFTVDGHGFDLTDPDAVRDLLDRTDGDAPVVIDFCHEPAALERVFRHLRDVTVLPTSRPGSPARVRFAAARYAPRPAGRTTYWQLGTPLVVTTARPAGPVARRAGTGSTGRVGAAPRAGARPPGTPSA
ncbi:hypothetical protein [Actinophytocola sp.]|uniref:hypothetical protein n=1 Tax=Actinophytocola sp. TaxID=1872138 RepID=UPI003D6C2AB9